VNFATSIRALKISSLLLYNWSIWVNSNETRAGDVKSDFTSCVAVFQSTAVPRIHVSLSITLKLWLNFLGIVLKTRNWIWCKTMRNHDQDVGVFF
jgi:hypothetical protein